MTSRKFVSVSGGVPRYRRSLCRWPSAMGIGAMTCRYESRYETSAARTGLASGVVKNLPRARLVPEGFTGDEAFELATASAAVCLFYAGANQAVILTAQVVVRVNVPWFSVKRFARWAQGHMNILL